MAEPMKFSNGIAVASAGQFKGYLRSSGGLRLGTTMTGINITTGSIKSRHLGLGSVSAGAVKTGAIRAKHLGLLSVTAGAFATASNGPLFTQSASIMRGNHAAASGTVIAGWNFFFARAVTVRSVSISFVTGPIGGKFGLKSFQLEDEGTIASKGVTTFPVAGSQRSWCNKSSLAITMHANSLMVMAVHTIGGTVAGGGGVPYVHYTYR